MTCTVGRGVEKCHSGRVATPEDVREVFGFGNSMVRAASEAALRDHPYDGPDAAVEQVPDNEASRKSAATGTARRVTPPGPPRRSGSPELASMVGRPFHERTAGSCPGDPMAVGNHHVLHC